MSIFTKVKDEFEKLFGEVETETPKATSAALTTLQFVSPLAVTVVSLIDPVAAPEAMAIANKVQTDLALLTTTIKSGGSAPTVISAIDGINANITSLESAVGVKNSTSATKITAITGTITGELNAIASEFAAAAAVPTASTVTPAS